MSELDVPIQPSVHHASALHHQQANTTASPREGARSVDPYLGSKHRTSINLKSGMHMIGEEEEREFIEEDTKSAMSRSRSNPAGSSAKELGFKLGSSTDLKKNEHIIEKSNAKLIPGKQRMRLNLRGSPSTMSSFARPPHSDIGKTQKNFGKNTMHALTLCDNEKAETYLEKDKLEKPGYVLKSTLNEKDDLRHRIAKIKNKLSTNKISGGIFVDR